MMIMVTQQKGGERMVRDINPQRYSEVRTKRDKSKQFL
jgi:hypothetical protein